MIFKKTKKTYFSLSVLFLLGFCPFNSSADNKNENLKFQEESYISCLGRIIPEGEIYYLTARQGQIVEKIFVNPGDVVKKGEILVTLSDYNEITASIKIEMANLSIAKGNLEKVKKGANKELIESNRATVEKLKLNNDYAKIALDRSQKLYEQNIISKEKLQNAELAYFAAEADFLSAVANLKNIEKVPEIDISLAESKVQLAEAQYEKAKTALQSAMIISPINGKILDVLSHPGENSKPNGILAVGNMDSFFVEAQVYVSDIKYVKVGAKVIITSDFFSDTLYGEVTKIFTVLGYKSVFDPNPVSFSDDRVIKTLIKLSSKEIPAKYINTEVTVKIAK